MFSERDLLDGYQIGDRSVPHLRANMISSLDGAASVGGLSGGLNDAWDKQVFDTLRMLADVVIVASGTLLAEGYGPLRVPEEAVAWRREHGLTDHPVLAAVTGSLSIPAGHPMLTEAPVRPLVLTCTDAPADRRAALAEVADVVDCGAHAAEPRTLRAVLTERGLPQQLCEGGPSLLGSVIADDALDELCLTLAPVLTVGDAPRIATRAPQVQRHMRLVQALPGGRMLFLRYLRDR